jgi:hypothetical protein
MTEIERLAEDLRRAYDGSPWHGSAVTAILAGVSATQAAARPVPGAHTIWELTLHMAAWAGEATRRLSGAPPAEPVEGDWPATPPAPDDAAWAAARLQLAEAHAELTGTVAARDTLSDLEAFTVNGVLQHHAYHAGQVSLLRKLVS